MKEGVDKIKSKKNTLHFVDLLAAQDR